MTYTYYIFTDTEDNTNYTILANSEDDAWAQVCDRLGTGYVFSNVELTVNPCAR